MQNIFRYAGSLGPNLLAMGYVVAAYVGGLILMLVSGLTLNILGLLFFTHAMIIAAYLIHECAHNNIFRENCYHRWLGEFLLWICGASYSHYDDVRYKHMRHHTDKADIVSFDYRTKIIHYPGLVKAIHFLEWLYIPAMEVIMHALVIILPFTKTARHHRRFRVVFVLLIRTLLFIYLININSMIIFLYPIAYLLFLTVMRFMDVHQHTYELFETLDQSRNSEKKRLDRSFEESNTYSNLISVKYPWLNLLVLNFPYHNAHHEQPGRPWHQLPNLHAELYSADDSQILSFRSLLKSYHRFRIQRVLNVDAINFPAKQLEDNFIGVDGVSFLTAH